MSRFGLDVVLLKWFYYGIILGLFYKVVWYIVKLIMNRFSFKGVVFILGGGWGGFGMSRGIKYFILIFIGYVLFFR